MPTPLQAQLIDASGFNQEISKQLLPLGLSEDRLFTF
jgi:hypothetical protein